MNIGFLAPALLWGLLAIPALWLILRAVPPAPILRRFPAVVLLLGLTDREHVADRTPWWLILLRALAVAAAIFGFAGPILNPAPAPISSAPLLIVLDGGWADGRDWPQLRKAAITAIEAAGRNAQPVAVIRLTDAPTPPVFQSAAAWSGQLTATDPAAWFPSDFQKWADVLPTVDFDTLWISDGLDHPDRGVLLTALNGAGTVEVLQSAHPLYALRAANFADGGIQIAAARLTADAAAEITVTAHGPDPSGIERVLYQTPLLFKMGAAEGSATLTMPAELRNRITRFEILGARSAGAISLTDDSLKRRKVAIIGGVEAEVLQLLSPSHYLLQALTPIADILKGDLSDILTAKPDIIILADVAKLTGAESDAVLTWVQAGGLLLRFAGPRLADADLGPDIDPLLPVRLRAGGRAAGGAMTWGEAKLLAPFPDNSPFSGLTVSPEITVSSQVLAQPDPDLTKATLAVLTDGTPLVTRRAIGAGQVVLFHITANPAWSNLPLSGLFVQMLERLTLSSGGQTVDRADLAGGAWAAEKLLDGFGKLRGGTGQFGVAGTDLAGAIAHGPSRDIPAGLYENGARKIALNVMGQDTKLTAFVWPNGTVLRGLDAPTPQKLKGALMALAVMLLALDVPAALWISGRLSLRRAVQGVVVALAITAVPGPSDAQDQAAIRATGGVVLAHVLTGDTDVDHMAEAGLVGLGAHLAARTSIEPDAPLGINLETDELAFFPFLYWPITADAPLPSAAVNAKLNRFLRTGGMIMFDTRDGDFGNAASPEGQALQLIASGLDIPALEPIPEDHVLTRSFYLISDFPGRATGGTTWVEASAMPDTATDGMPFRNLNDGVSPVIIGANDWAAAWAVDDAGVPMLPVGRGMAGDTQREYAYRFGINVIMHVLTGNYKSDQVHVPALLDRLGQ